MSNPRTFLLVALAFVAILMWQAWEQEFAPAPSPATSTAAQTDRTTSTATATSTANKAQDVPAPITGNVAASPTPPPPSSVAKQAPSQHVEVKTDVLRINIDTRGGTLIDADLLNYPQSQQDKNTPVRLLDDEPQHFFIAQSGLVSASSPAPDHDAIYQTEKTGYTLAAGQDKLEVPLVWQDASGLKVHKTYIFTRGSYLIEVREQIDNGGSAAWSGNAYRQLQRVPPVIKSTHGFEFSNPERYAFAGAAWYSPEDKFKKLAFDKFAKDPLNATTAGGWVAMLQHYFFAAWIPEARETDHFSSALVDTAQGQRYLIRALSPTINIPAGKDTTLTSHLYVGPTLQNQLEQIDNAGIAKGLELTADYGMLTPIAQPMHWILVELHKLVRNWGLAIILLVLLIKLALFKISEAQYRSMAKMRKLQPRMQALKERYGDDKQKLSAATMEMYKKEKINPLGGCIPTLIQIPVFFALYYVLLESVELRQAPFFGWIHNLSAPDPYFVLPIVNALIMIGSQYLMPASPGMDPTQAKMMKVMPVMFAVLFLFFPAGLVLYYTVNGGLSLLQQWIITKRIQASEAHAK